VLVNGDTADETDAAFFVNLGRAVNATITRGQGLGRIQNDDAPPPTVSISDDSVPEGDSGSSIATITVLLSDPSTSTVTVQYATSNGTATAGSDYTATSGTLTFTPGQMRKLIPVSVSGDTTSEPDETFTVTLFSPTNATLETAQATGTITTDDIAPATPSVSIAGASLAEGNSGTANAGFTVTLSAASASTVSVQYATANGTATAGSDYTTTSGTLTFAPGQTSKPIPVPVIGDTTVEADETFTVTLSSPTNATLGTAQATGTITNDDSASAACSPRPRVALTSIRQPDGRLQVTVTAGNGPLQSIQFCTATRSLQNGMVQIDAQQVTARTTVPLAANTTTKTFMIIRTNPAATMTVPLIVTDGCGAWETFVGVGTGS
jgi:hypothetical protein